MLADVPQVSVSIPKETYWFGTDLRGMRRAVGIDTRDDYERCFRRGGMTCDASTLYLASDDAIQQVVDTNPQVHVIVCVRPIWALLNSYHRQLMRYGWAASQDVNEAWRSSLDTRAELPVPWLADYQRVSAIGSQLARLRSLIDPRQVTVVPSSVLRDTPGTVISALCVMWGIRPPLEVRSVMANEARQPRLRAGFNLLSRPTVRRIAAASKRNLPPAVMSMARRAKDVVVFGGDNVQPGPPEPDVKRFCDVEQHRLDEQLASSWSTACETILRSQSSALHP